EKNKYFEDLKQYDAELKNPSLTSKKRQEVRISISAVEKNIIRIDQEMKNLSQPIITQQPVITQPYSLSQNQLDDSQYELFRTPDSLKGKMMLEGLSTQGQKFILNNFESAKQQQLNMPYMSLSSSSSLSSSPEEVLDPNTTMLANPSIQVPGTIYGMQGIILVDQVTNEPLSFILPNGKVISLPSKESENKVIDLLGLINMDEKTSALLQEAISDIKSINYSEYKRIVANNTVETADKAFTQNVGAELYKKFPALLANTEIKRILIEITKDTLNTLKKIRMRTQALEEIKKQLNAKSLVAGMLSNTPVVMKVKSDTKEAVIDLTRVLQEQERDEAIRKGISVNISSSSSFNSPDENEDERNMRMRIRALEETRKSLNAKSLVAGMLDNEPVVVEEKEVVIEPPIPAVVEQLVSDDVFDIAKKLDDIILNKEVEGKVMSVDAIISKINSKEIITHQMALRIAQLDTDKQSVIFDKILNKYMELNNIKKGEEYDKLIRKGASIDKSIITPVLANIIDKKSMPQKIDIIISEKHKIRYLIQNLIDTPGSFIPLNPNFIRPLVI
ncbi:MAG: hypothetical protein AABY22_11345, partial [Nanoarchaeota archaeon]